MESKTSHVLGHKKVNYDLQFGIITMFITTDSYPAIFAFFFFTFLRVICRFRF